MREIFTSFENPAIHEAGIFDSLDFEIARVLRIHPPHGSFQLGLGDVEITQCTIVVDPRLG